MNIASCQAYVQACDLFGGKWAHCLPQWVPNLAPLLQSQALLPVVVPWWGTRTVRLRLLLAVPLSPPRALLDQGHAVFIAAALQSGLKSDTVAHMLAESFRGPLLGEIHM